MRLDNNDLTGWNFANQNLTNAKFYYDSFGSTLTNANFSGAIVKGADFSGTTYRLYRQPTLQHRQLRQRRSDGHWTWRNDLTGWNFANQNLTNANFGYSTQLGAPSS